MMYTYSLSSFFRILIVTPISDKIQFVCVMQASDAFKLASQHNPQSTEVARKIKRVTQLSKDKKRSEEVDNMRSNVDLAKHLDGFKSDLVILFRNQMKTFCLNINFLISLQSAFC